MSVVVRGMKMPYGCANCNFVGSPIYDCKGRAIYSCNVPVDGISGKNVTEQVIDMYEGGGGDYFPDWCPLVDLGKHGRLIDADAIVNAMNDMKVEGEVFVTAVNYVKLIMNDADTIVEAEDGT